KDEGKKGTKEEAPPLKGALADVLSRSDMKPASAVPAAEPAPKPKAEKPAQEPAAPGPFEVPEDTLKAIFNEQL
ncbi:MAG TPA: hypothetical protein VN086_00010, partial [Candidatus Paceibacterota bacterium]|nr:hypothetical protein [Candidatus Paceibacterota bacterium]